MFILMIAAIALVALTAVDAKLWPQEGSSHRLGNSRRTPPRRVTPRRRSQGGALPRPRVTVSGARSATGAGTRIARWWWE
jgi:hypothetical protein